MSTHTVRVCVVTFYIREVSDCQDWSNKPQRGFWCAKRGNHRWLYSLNRTRVGGINYISDGMVWGIRHSAVSMRCHMPQTDEDSR